MIGFLFPRSQVDQMARIYQEATAVFMWLGPDADDSTVVT